MSRRARRRLFDVRRPRRGAPTPLSRAVSALASRLEALRLPPASRRRVAAFGGLAVVLTSLGVVAFRTEILRARYELGDLMREEARLREERAALRVAVRRLRDPARLERLAREAGFGPPERLIELAEPEETKP